LKFLCLIFFLLLITYSTNCFALSKSANEIVVPTDYTTIQDAINAASSYDVIYVKSGVYKEKLLVDKPLFIRGAVGETVAIVAEDDADILTIEASNVTVSNFLICKSVGYSSKSAGVRLSNASRCMIENNTIVGNFIGVLIEGGSFNFVQNNVVTMNHYGIFVRRYQHDVESYGNVIFNNLIANNSWNGIEIDWGGANTVSSNTISYNFAFGLEIPDYTPSSMNVIFHNNFVGNADAFGKIYQAYAPENNYWNFSGEGNYWSDFYGVDEDYDAISDLPYVPSRNVIDYFPLMGTFRTFTVCNYNVNIISNASAYEFSYSITNDEGQPFVINLLISSDSEWFARISLPKHLYSFSSLEVNGSSYECRNFTENDSYINLYLNCSSGVYVVRIYGFLIGESLLVCTLSLTFIYSVLICYKKVRRCAKTIKA